MPSYRHIWILGERAEPPTEAEITEVKALLAAANVKFIGDGLPMSAKAGTTLLCVIPCETHTFRVRFYQGEIEVTADIPTVGGTNLENQIVRILQINKATMNRSITNKRF